MRSYSQLAALLGGTAATTALVMTVASPARALSGVQVNDIAREITVLIRGERGHGSGVIIQKSGNTYYVLTAEHVVADQDNFKLVTADKQAYQIDNAKIRRIAGVDLAIVEFTSDKNYQVAKIGTAKSSEGQDVFVSGWPANGAMGKAAGGEIIRQFTSGSISGFLPKPLKGYAMIYTNITRAGMSGCPVLDTAGRLVGIHGMGDKEDASRLKESGGLTQEAANRLAKTIKPGFNYAIPIATFLQKAGSIGINTGSLSIDVAKAPEAGAPYVPSNNVDSRDRLDIKSALATVRQVTETVRDVNNTVRDAKNSIQDLQNMFRW